MDKVTEALCKDCGLWERRKNRQKHVGTCERCLKENQTLVNVIPPERKKKKDPIKPKRNPRNENGAGGVAKIYTDEFIEKEAEAFLEWMKDPKNIYFKRFALSRGYTSQRFSEWEKTNRKFAEIFSIVKEWQESRLAEGGLTSEFNGGFCKFVMGNVCKWSDNHHTVVSGDNQNPLSFVVSDVDGKSKELVDESD